MRELTISDRECGQRMDRYLCRVLDRAPKSFIYRMLRKKNIVLNDRRAAGGEILKAADRIKIYFADDTFEKFASPFFGGGEGMPERDPGADARFFRKGEPELAIVYEDEDILVIDKPAGLLSQKASAGDDSANDRIIRYLLASGQLTQEELRTFRPSICNRLDRNTSGLLVAGKTMRGLRQMAQQLKCRSVKKFYRAIAMGRMERARHERAYLSKDRAANRVQIRTDGPGNAIETAFSPISHFKDATLLEARLFTGRPHQIRAHLAFLGHPILGDAKYGDAAANRALFEATGIRGQLLHACRMEFSDGRVFTSGEPDTFRRVGEWLRQNPAGRNFMGG